MLNFVHYKCSTGIPVAPVFMAPSVTPAEDHNPAIRLVKYDRPTGKTVRITRPCNLHPLTPHFYIVELGFTRGRFFLFVLQNIDLGDSLVPPQ